MLARRQFDTSSAREFRREFGSAFAMIGSLLGKGHTVLFQLCMENLMLLCSRQSRIACSGSWGSRCVQRVLFLFYTPRKGKTCNWCGCSTVAWTLLHMLRSRTLWMPPMWLLLYKRCMFFCNFHLMGRNPWFSNSGFLLFRLLLIQIFSIVALYHITHTFYTAVAHFHIVLVEEFSVLMMRWEMLMNKTHKPFTYISLHISTKWRIDP